MDTVDVSKDPNAKYAPVRWQVRGWPRSTASIVKTMDTDPLAVRTKFVQHELDMVKKLHDAGVPFLASTDTPAGVDVLPGFSLHQELQRFVAAGFTPLEALQTATINPARFLGTLKDMGTVERGKIADLVLLDANPLTAIENTLRVSAVVAAGRYYSRADLDRILAQVEATAQSIK